MTRSKASIDVEMTDVDLTPMIDVCFLLIAFFIMVTEVTKSEVVEIFLPQASYALEDTNPPEDRVIINVDRNGEIWMRGKNFGRPNSKDGKRLLQLELKNIAETIGYDEAISGNPSRLTVLIRADAHVQNRFVQCLQMLLVEARVMKVHYSANNPVRD